MSYDQDALDAASREVHMHLLREGSSWGTKACEEMGRIFMTAYLKAAPRPEAATQFDAVGWWDGEKALFEPNQIPVRGALLFRPRPSALNPKAAWPFPEKRIEPQSPRQEKP